MKNKFLSFALAISFVSVSAFAQEEVKTTVKKDIQILEASCGSCMLGLEGSGCSLAVKIDGKSYPVEGVDFHKLGDPHAKDGMCNVVRVAEVNGELEEGVFIASSFNILPVGTKIPVVKNKKDCSKECAKDCCKDKKNAKHKSCAPGCKKSIGS